MKAVQDSIGDVDILVQAADDTQIEIVNTSTEKPQIMETSRGHVEKAYEAAKKVITSIAKDIGNEFDAMKKDPETKNPPQQFEMEFSMGISAKAGVWILGLEDKNSFKIKMTWNA